MKHAFFLFCCITISSVVASQVPEAFNYQALLRNSSGEPMMNESVVIELNIRQGSTSGSLAYSEVHTTQTNEFGLVNLTIGKGTTSQHLSDINWTEGPYFIEVLVNDVSIGTSQLLSVPYALFAGSVDNNDDADSDPTNEVQDLKLDGNILSITLNGSATQIDLNPYLDDTDTKLTEQEVDDFVGNNGYLTSEIDGSVTNEIQNLSIDGNALSISEGNSVTLPAGESAWVSSGENLYYSGGNLGIGISTPLAKLTVLSEDLPVSTDSRVNWLRLYGNSSNSDNLYVFHRRHAEGADWNSSEVVMQKQVDATPMHYISFKGLASNDSRLEMGYADTPYFTLTKAGRIGINTTTPSKFLDVNGSVKFGSDMNLWNGEKSLHFRQDANNSWISNIADFVSNGSSGNGDLNLVGETGVNLRYGLGSGAGTTGLALTDQGNVGIGVSDPGNFILHVNENKDVRFGHYVNIADYDHEDPDAQIISRDGNLNVWTGSLIVGRYGNEVIGQIGNGNLKVQNNAIIDGNIGVGKLPSVQVDVAGTIKSANSMNNSTGYLGRVNYGVQGSSTNTGVFGSGAFIGVRGYSAEGTAILGQSYSGYAGEFYGDVHLENDLQVNGSIRLGTFGIDSLLIIQGATSTAGFADYPLPEGWNFDNTFVLSCEFKHVSTFNSDLTVYQEAFWSENTDSNIKDGDRYEIAHLGSDSYVFRVYSRRYFSGSYHNFYSNFKALLLKTD